MRGSAKKEKKTEMAEFGFNMSGATPSPVTAANKKQLAIVTAPVPPRQTKVVAPAKGPRGKEKEPKKKIERFTELEFDQTKRDKDSTLEDCTNMFFIFVKNYQMVMSRKNGMY